MESKGVLLWEDLYTHDLYISCKEPVIVWLLRSQGSERSG